MPQGVTEFSNTRGKAVLNLSNVGRGRFGVAFQEALIMLPTEGRQYPLNGRK